MRSGGAMKVSLKIAALIALYGLGGCDYLGTFPKNIREFPEPWQVLETGKQPEIRSRIEIVAEGEGREVEEGDLVQICTKFWSIEDGKFGPSRDWWLWIGFRLRTDTAFFSANPAQRAALLGLKEGSAVKFLEHQDNPMDAEKLYVNPVGDQKYYSWRKNTHDFGAIFTPYKNGYSLVEIKRVCKGQAKYRTVRLFDDSPVQICSGVNCRVSRGINEAWAEEARIDAVCQDGKKASFQYGPIGDRGHSSQHGYFDRWFYEAWKKLPVGVQLN